MIIKKFKFNPFPVNTFILYDETNECVVIDAGMLFDNEKEQFNSFITSNNLKIKHLLNTHLHFDHIVGNPFIEKKFGMKAKAHEADIFLLNRAKEQAAMYGFHLDDENISLETFINEEDVIQFGNSELKILHVPGHSPGSLVFYSVANKCIFSGDVLFYQSIGRTDLPGGNYQELIDNIQEKLLILPDETLVYPGHGPTTTIGKEKRGNMFLA